MQEPCHPHSIAPDDAATWNQRAVAYRHACGEIIDRFADVGQPEQAEDVVWTCVLAPDAVADYTELVKLANGVAEIRPGDFEALSAANDSPPKAAEDAADRADE